MGCRRRWPLGCVGIHDADDFRVIENPQGHGPQPRLGWRIGPLTRDPSATVAARRLFMCCS